MFDNIKCKYPLPLSEYQDLEYQTKDLDNLLFEFEIGEDKKLYKITHNYEPREELEPPEHIKFFSKEYSDWMNAHPRKYLGMTRETIPFTGVITFYTGIPIYASDEDEDKSARLLKGNHWVEFDAYFNHGTLDKLELKKNEDMFYDSVPKL